MNYSSDLYGLNDLTKKPLPLIDLICVGRVQNPKLVEEFGVGVGAERFEAARIFSVVSYLHLHNDWSREMIDNVELDLDLQHINDWSREMIDNVELALDLQHIARFPLNVKISSGNR
ncbi:hypothetical protein P8452_18159 [Trifolium repens]|nr:hypothetical protein P8452_18159 [Trifolium repens]